MKESFSCKEFAMIAGPTNITVADIILTSITKTPTADSKDLRASNGSLIKKRVYSELDKWDFEAIFQFEDTVTDLAAEALKLAAEKFSFETTGGETIFTEIAPDPDSFNVRFSNEDYTVISFSVTTKKDKTAVFTRI